MNLIVLKSLVLRKKKKKTNTPTRQNVNRASEDLDTNADDYKVRQI